MSTQSNQSRARGFTPLFRGVYSDQNLRVSDAERQAVADRLAEHFADGRLDQAEFDERVERAMSAKTRADLNGLFDDLPEGGLPGGDLPDTGAPAVPGRPRRGHRHPVVLLALFVLLAVTVGHALFWITVPLLWVGLLVAGVLFATGHLGRHHPTRDR
jgi:hypothetical protein